MTLAAGLPAAWIVKDRYASRSTPFIEWPLFRDFSFLHSILRRRSGDVRPIRARFFLSAVTRTRSDFLLAQVRRCFRASISPLHLVGSSLAFRATTLGP